MTPNTRVRHPISHRSFSLFYDHLFGRLEKKRWLSRTKKNKSKRFYSIRVRLSLARDDYTVRCFIAAPTQTEVPKKGARRPNSI
ncbi:Uncharacterized protein APZ42_022966 [Daphnia magna]|uniref:Uncharacterized protein n=1 Tax=Daphnia magna TaxID=35525 RepID=A0A164VBS0_9CRUS|nr:Uncharacterized protein APZ42_022966 [Daphnia magna]